MAYQNSNQSFAQKTPNRALPFRKCFFSTLNPVGKFYAGIGARDAPKHIKEIALKLGYYLALEGYILRSGGAEGMDDYFEAGADLAMMQLSTVQKQIFLPNPNAWGNPSCWNMPSEEALKTVEIYHKYGKNMESRTKNLMGRNAHQVLGPDLKEHSKFVVCWTKDGCITDEARNYDKKLGTGGTGQAISIADAHSIPIFNLQRKEDLNKILNKIKIWENKHGLCPDVKLLMNAKPKAEQKILKI